MKAGNGIAYIGILFFLGPLTRSIWPLVQLLFQASGNVTLFNTTRGENMVHTDSMSIDMDNNTDGDQFEFAPASNGFSLKDSTNLQLIVFRAVLVIASLFLMVNAVRGDTPPASFFPIGVYWQSVSSYDTWQARGVNTVIFFSDRDDWLMESQNAALAHNFWMIRNPQKNIAADKYQKNLLAISHPDEPDINYISPESIAQNYAQWKSLAPNVPVITNFSGQNAMYQADGLTDDLYKKFIKSSDWTSSDVYPVTAWNRPDWIDKKVKLDLNDPTNNGGLPFTAGNSVDKLRDLSGGKKQMAYIETSFQNLGGFSRRSATPAEVRGQTWDAILHGAKGILYFPQQFAPDKSDATSPEVSAEMTKTNAKITKMGEVLNAVPDSQSNFMNLTGGLEGTWRKFGNKTFYFILNFSHDSAYKADVQLWGAKGKAEVVDEHRELLLAGNTINDSFDPYELHIYEVNDSTDATIPNNGSGNNSSGNNGSGSTPSTNNPNSGRPVKTPRKHVRTHPRLANHGGAHTGMDKHVHAGQSRGEHLAGGARTGLQAHHFSQFSDDLTISHVTVSPVPEPTSALALMVLGSGALLRRTRKQVSK